MTEETTQQPAEQQDQNLLNQSADTQTETPVETDRSTDSVRPEWLPEKFKTAEDFAKSYKELETKISDQPKAPDTYDFSFAPDMGIEMNEQQTKEANDMFKQYNLTQEQAKGMLSLYSDSIKAFAEQYTQSQVTVDADVEQNQLKNTWGREYEQKMGSLRNFSKTLKQDTMNAPLANTAEGLQILYDAMAYRNGPNPIADAPTSQASMLSIREKINDIRKSAEYNLPQGDPLGEAKRAEMYQLYQQLERMGNRE
jgi:hypothetical protein